jgi:hypothetical protein
MAMVNAFLIPKYHMVPIPVEKCRRQNTRYRCEMSLSLQILFPEETFTPASFACRSYDVSITGMRVYFDKLPVEFYLKLLPKTRFARISFTDPFSGGEIKITGCIHWADYHRPETEDQCGSCYIGINFDDRDNRDLSRYREFVETMLANYPEGGMLLAG